MAGFVYLGSALLTSIGDAIRAKINSSDLMTVAQMAEAIDLIVDQEEGSSTTTTTTTTTSQIGNITLKSGLIELPSSLQVATVNTTYMLSSSEYFFECTTASNKCIIYYYNGSWSTIITASSSAVSIIDTSFSTNYYFLGYKGTATRPYDQKLFKISTHEFFNIQIGIGSYNTFNIKFWESSTQIIVKSQNTTYSQPSYYTIFNKSTNTYTTFTRPYIDSNYSYGSYNGEGFILTDLGLLIDNKVNNKYQVERINLDDTITVIINNLVYGTYNYRSISFITNGYFIIGEFSTNAATHVYSVNLTTLEKTTFTSTSSYPYNLTQVTDIPGFSNLKLLYRPGYSIFIYDSSDNTLTPTNITAWNGYDSSGSDAPRMQNITTSAGNKIMLITAKAYLYDHIYDVDNKTTTTLNTSTSLKSESTYTYYRIVGTKFYVLSGSGGYYLYEIDLTTNTQTTLLNTSLYSYTNCIFLDDDTHILIADNTYNQSYGLAEYNYITKTGIRKLCTGGVFDLRDDKSIIKYGNLWYFISGSASNARPSWCMNMDNIETGSASEITDYSSMYYGVIVNKDSTGASKGAIVKGRRSSSSDSYTYYFIDLVNSKATSLGVNPDIKNASGASYIVDSGKVVKIDLTNGTYSVIYTLPTTTTTSITSYGNGYLILNKYLYYLDTTNSTVYLTNNLVTELNYNSSTDKFTCNGVIYTFNSTTRKLVWESATI